MAQRRRPKWPLEKTEAQTEMITDGRKPSEQALQAVDVAFGAVPTVAEAVRNTADTWRNPETRSQEIETLQKRVSTLREAEARTSEIESLRRRLGSELEKAETRVATSAARSPSSSSARLGRRASASSRCIASASSRP